jgi:hypothetical protein
MNFNSFKITIKIFWNPEKIEKYLKKIVTPCKIHGQILKILGVRRKISGINCVKSYISNFKRV